MFRKYLVSFSQLISGTFLAKIITVFSAVILAKIYPVDAFGTLATFISILSISVVISTGRYEMAIVPQQKLKNAEVIYAGTIYLSVAISCLILLLILFLAYFGITFENKIDTTSLYFIPFSCLFLSIYKTDLQLRNRVSNYKSIAIIEPAQAITISASKFLFFYTLPSGKGLILAHSFGLFFFVTSVFFVSKRYENVIAKTSFKEVLSLLKANIKFPRSLILSDLISAFSLQAPILLTAMYFDNQTVGFLSMALALVGTPLQLIGTAIGRVFRNDVVSEFGRTGKCDVFFEKYLFFVTPVMVIPFLFLYFFSPDIFSVFLGKEWEASGNFVQSLIFMFFFQAMSRVFSYIYIVRKKLFENLLVQLTLLVGISLFYILANNEFDSFNGFLNGLSMIYSLVYIFVLIRSYILSKG